MRLHFLLSLCLFPSALFAQGQPVIVISVDGLDHRYLCDADSLGLKIPTLRKLMREGEFTGGLLATEDAATAAWLRSSGRLGREVPAEELRRFAPELKALAAFEPRRHEGFANKPGEPLYVAPYEPGNHGWWPGLADYRAGYVLWGRGISPRQTPVLPMESVATRLAALLGVKLER
jgi:hypothetical protein